jgi:hypothetical protein
VRIAEALRFFDRHHLRGYISVHDLLLTTALAPCRRDQVLG